MGMLALIQRTPTPLCFPLLYRRHFAYPHAKYLPYYMGKILHTPTQTITNQLPLILKPTLTLIVGASVPNCRNRRYLAWGYAKCLLYSRGKHNGVGVRYINASIPIYRRHFAYSYAQSLLYIGGMHIQLYREYARGRMIELLQHQYVKPCQNCCVSHLN